MEELVSLPLILLCVQCNPEPLLSDTLSLSNLISLMHFFKVLQSNLSDDVS